MIIIDTHTITDVINRRRLMAETGLLVQEVRSFACAMALALGDQVDIDEFMLDCGF